MSVKEAVQQRSDHAAYAVVEAINEILQLERKSIELHNQAKVIDDKFEEVEDQKKLLVKRISLHTGDRLFRANGIFWQVDDSDLKKLHVQDFDSPEIIDGE